MDTTVPILIGLGALLLLGLGAVLDDRRARLRRRDDRDAAQAAVPLLHSINDDRCIGCEACVDVCPTEVLDLVDHKVRVARFSDCVQCEQCASACPTQALVMYRAGTTPRVLTVPEIDEHFQTGVPGQYLIGEVAGKPLVKNAANLGRAVIEHIARDLAGKPGAPGVLDVAIVGSGPGGLSAGLACIRHGLSCLVLEKEHVIASTVARYPKGKHFMAEPCSAQNVSYLPVFDGSKEQLVAAWTQLVQAVELPIRLGEAVETVQRGDDGVFTIKTTVASYRARAVVLATGLRGKPRLLAVPGANLEKVQSLLDDPAEFAGEHALVVGGGDSAVEGAIALAEAGATVALSYRGDGFKRCKQGNQKRLAEMTADRRLTVLLESNITRFTPDAVTIACKDREITIPNQRAFVLIGADTPIAWLEANQVRFVERPHLYALGSTEDVVRRFAPDATECPRSPEDALAALLDRPHDRRPHDRRPHDRPAPRQPVRRMKSVAQHLREEIWDVVTSVSAAFRLSDLEADHHARRAVAHTPARGVAHQGPGSLIPASRLVAGRSATGASPLVRAGLEHTAIGAPAPAAEALRPRSHRRGTTTAGTAALPVLRAQLTTDAVPSLRALETAAGLSGTPSPGAHTDEMAALRRSLDEPTDEIDPLRAREQQAAQIAALRPGNDPTRVLALHPAASDSTRATAAPRTTAGAPTRAAAPSPAVGDPTRVGAALRTTAGERPPAAAPPSAHYTPRAATPPPVPRSPTVTATVTVAIELPADELPTDEISSLRTLEETVNERPSLRVRERAAAERHAFDHTDVAVGVAVGSIETDRAASPAVTRRLRRPSDPVLTSAPRLMPAPAAPDAPRAPVSPPRRSGPPPVPPSAPASPPRRSSPPPVPPSRMPRARGSEPMPHPASPDALAERTPPPTPTAPPARSAAVAARTRLAR
jgi:thioredoxin reductase/ferredoxin